MKKIFKFLLCVFLLVSCQTAEKCYIDITPEELFAKIENDESFTFFIGTKYCSNCKQYKANINTELTGTDYEFYYLDFTDDEVSEIMMDFATGLAEVFIPDFFYVDKEMTIERDGQRLMYTPTTYKFLNGKCVYVFIGSLEGDEITDILNNNLVNIGFYQNAKRMVENLESFAIYYVSEDYDMTSIRENAVDRHIIEYYVTDNYLSLDDKLAILSDATIYGGQTFEEMPELLKFTYNQGILTKVESK